MMNIPTPTSSLRNTSALRRSVAAASLDVQTLSNEVAQAERARVRVAAGAYRFNPYGMAVLSSRDYPTPVYVKADSTKKHLQADGTVCNLLALEGWAVGHDEHNDDAAAVSIKGTSSRKSSQSSPMDSCESLSISDHPELDPSSSAVPHYHYQAAQPHETSQQRGRRHTSCPCRVRVQFKRGDDVYYSTRRYAVGEFIMVEGDRGQDMGVVKQILPVKGHAVANVVGPASATQRAALDGMRREEDDAVALCQRRVAEHGLEGKMTIEDVEFQYDGNKVTIYYSSPCSVDFRQLQRQLFRDFRCRVWLRTVPATTTA
eukprot:PhM_4_TR13684/c1_g1_i2/m.75362